MNRLAQLLQPLDVSGLERLDQASTLPHPFGQQASPQNRGGRGGRRRALFDIAHETQRLVFVASLPQGATEGLDRRHHIIRRIRESSAAEKWQCRTQPAGRDAVRREWPRRRRRGPAPISCCSVSRFERTTSLTVGMTSVPMQAPGSGSHSPFRRTRGGRNQRSWPSALGGKTVEVDAADRALLELDRRARADQPRRELADVRLVADQRDARLAGMLGDFLHHRGRRAGGRQRIAVTDRRLRLRGVRRRRPPSAGCASAGC